jgi:hypothetical protein
MITNAELQEHKLETIEKIRKYLDKIIEDDDGNSGFISHLSDLLCRVGELESTILYQFDRNIDPNCEPRRNRLCECYGEDNNE